LCIDYETILKKGYRHYARKVKNELINCSEGGKKTYLEAMLISIDAIGSFIERIRQLVLEKAASSLDRENRERFTAMGEALRKVPMAGADDFFEALQSLWLAHSLAAIADNCWASISLGRADQYLYPFFQKLKSPEEREKAAAFLRHFFRLLDSYGDGACALNIGGLDIHGNDQMNGLSELIIDTEKTMRLRAPILAARISKKTPERIFDSLIDKSLFSIGQPTFYAEESCREAVRKRGLSEEDAARFSVNSCMGLMIAGEEIADMWGWLFNAHLPLEMAINGGKGLHGDLPFAVEKKTDVPGDADSLFTFYEFYCTQVLKVCLDLNRKTALETACSQMRPLISALTAGCIESGLDRAVGAKYQNVTVEAMGLVNTANAITAMEALVFDAKKYSLADFAAAASSDFAGFTELRRDIQACPKYGEGSDKADANARRLAAVFASACKKFDFANTRYLASLHTLDANVAFGGRLYSTLDGRLKGEPVNKNAGATNDARNSGPTAMILSAASIDQTEFSGGQPVDVSFLGGALSSSEGRAKIKALIKTYFGLGGLQFQVNCVDSALLEKAYADPKKYPDVIVRIGGYSVRFADMGKQSQLELITRIKSEEAAA